MTIIILAGIGVGLFGFVGLVAPFSVNGLHYPWGWSPADFCFSLIVLTNMLTVVGCITMEERTPSDRKALIKSAIAFGGLSSLGSIFAAVLWFLVSRIHFLSPGIISEKVLLVWVTLVGLLIITLAATSIDSVRELRELRAKAACA